MLDLIWKRLQEYKQVSALLPCLQRIALLADRGDIASNCLTKIMDNANLEQSADADQPKILFLRPRYPLGGFSSLLPEEHTQLGRLLLHVTHVVELKLRGRQLASWKLT